MRGRLITAAVVVWILAGVFFGYACLLSTGDSLQPDANQEAIRKLELELVRVSIKVDENRDNLLSDAQRQLQRKGFFLVIADSSKRLRILYRKPGR